MLPNGNILTQIGWTKVVEITPDKQIAYEYAAATMDDNSGKRVQVHAVQRLDDGLTMIAESGPARNLEVDCAGNIHREIKFKVNHPTAHSDTRLVRRTTKGTYLVAHESNGAMHE